MKMFLTLKRTLSQTEVSTKNQDFPEKSSLCRVCRICYRGGFKGI